MSKNIMKIDETYQISKCQLIVNEKTFTIKEFIQNKKGGKRYSILISTEDGFEIKVHFDHCNFLDESQ